ncbi:sensor histidine kinase [Pseudoalteromonas sp. G4]|uniref:sensor histidine kinase n=1 Tax=Pseudoalteromonas sp. G4 TaxID=2992761 RepID=UPI00237DC35E|nr:HAMP domain-containing sensor histidine kinase [Pseudoalteromonas sp. G4]MDE3273966.1 HAMP domain-containing histidine kinase [Pseudoalteromonas sp. G4]
MPTSHKTITIRKALSRAVIVITSLSILLSVIVSTVLDVSNQKKNLIEELNTLAGIISFNAYVPLVFVDKDEMQKQLKAYEKIEYIKNIHIYQVDDFTGTISLFATYDTGDNPPIPSRVKKLSNKITANVEGDIIEVIYPIRTDDIDGVSTTNPKIDGYVYILGTDAPIQKALKNRVSIDVVVGLVILVSVLLITLTFQRRFSRPIEALSAVVKDVSKNKNYDVIVPNAKITELDMLAKSINTLFARTLAQLERQKKDEQEIRQLNQNLELKVNQRTVALKEANQELLSTLERMHQYQTKIVENEKMASLGQMVAGVAHEVNTPLGLGITGSTLLKDKLEELKSHFDNKTLTSSHMSRFIEDGVENLDLIYRNLNRAAELVSSFKQLAVTHETQEGKRINLYDFTHEVISTLTGELAKFPHEVSVEGDRTLEIWTKPPVIQQIVENLISNSLIHAFNSEQHGHIVITISEFNNNAIIDYQDDGNGVPIDIRSRIFDPFVTTRRGEGGSGLGMHLVYNLVTQALDGSIKLNTEAQKGAHFIIEIPIIEGDF